MEKLLGANSNDHQKIFLLATKIILPKLFCRTYTWALIFLGGIEMKEKPEMDYSLEVFHIEERSNFLKILDRSTL